MPAHRRAEPEASDRPPDWKPPPPPKAEGPIEARAVRATYVDEIDSDDSDDEREWSLTPRPLGVRRDQGARQGQAGRRLIWFGEGTRRTRARSRLGAWRLSVGAVARGEQAPGAAS